MNKWLYGHEERDRDRGILSPADREFLTSGGQNLNSESARQNARYRIRNRIRNAIIDFDLITRLLDEEDQRLVVGEKDEWEPAFISGQKAMIEFLYTTLEDADTSVDFETILKSGVHDAELKQHDEPTFVKVDFNVESDVQFDIKAARKRFEEGESLTIEEIGALLATGEIGDDELDSLSELAQEKGVVETSISPLQMHYAEHETDMSTASTSAESASFPASGARRDRDLSLRGFLARGESLMLTNAYTQNRVSEDSSDTSDGEETSTSDSETGTDEDE